MVSVFSSSSYINIKGIAHELLQDGHHSVQAYTETMCSIIH